MPRLGDLEATIYERLNYPPNPDPVVANRVRRALNETHRQILGKRGFDRLRRALVTFNSITSNPFAVLPQAVVKIHTIADRTRKYELVETTYASLRYSDPGLAASSSFPYEYVIDSLAAPVAQDPSDASELFVKSDSSSDSSGTTAYLEGVTSDGEYRTASVSLNGTSAVSLNTAITTWLTVRKFYLSAPPTGTVTLYEDSGSGTALSIIAPQHVSARYSRIHLHPTPTGIVTYHCDVELHVEDMTAANDEPILPEDFHWLLECGALSREYQKRKDFTSMSAEEAKMVKGISDLRAFVRQASGSTQNDRRPTRFSQLGPYYPPGS